MMKLSMSKATHEIVLISPPASSVRRKMGAVAAILLPDMPVDATSSVSSTRSCFEDGSTVWWTSRPHPTHHLAFYGRQLHAYAYALEHAGEQIPASTHRAWGCWSSNRMRSKRPSTGALPTWAADRQEVPHDEAAFLDFLVK
jgi:hypothetical protein